MDFVIIISLQNDNNIWIQYRIELVYELFSVLSDKSLSINSMVDIKVTVLIDKEENYWKELKQA
jgi:hypothetical protein